MPSAVELVLAELSSNPTGATTVGIESAAAFFRKTGIPLLGKTGITYMERTRSRLAEILEGFLDELKSFLGERQV
jgi:hypothetical protein